MLLVEGKNLSSKHVLALINKQKYIALEFAVEFYISLEKPLR